LSQQVYLKLSGLGLTEIIPREDIDKKSIREISSDREISSEENKIPIASKLQPELFFPGLFKNKNGTFGQNKLQTFSLELGLEKEPRLELIPQMEKEKLFPSGYLNSDFDKELTIKLKHGLWNSKTQLK
jgi:hypothetical protein